MSYDSKSTVSKSKPVVDDTRASLFQSVDRLIVSTPGSRSAMQESVRIVAKAGLATNEMFDVSTGAASLEEIDRLGDDLGLESTADASDVVAAVRRYVVRKSTEGGAVKSRAVLQAVMIWLLTKNEIRKNEEAYND